MPKPIKFSGQVADDGTPSPSLLDNFLKACRAFAGKKVTTETRAALRSLSANAYYWGVVVDAVMHLFHDWGWSATDYETHDWLKRQFLGVELVEVPSGDLQSVVVREMVRTTRTDEWTFGEYVRAIETHEAFIDAGLFVPSPEGKLTGRTIHEPGGTSLTFRDPKAAAPEEAPASPSPGPSLGAVAEMDAGELEAYLNDHF